MRIRLQEVPVVFAHLHSLLRFYYAPKEPGDTSVSDSREWVSNVQPYASLNAFVLIFFILLAYFMSARITSSDS